MRRTRCLRASITAAAAFLVAARAATTTTTTAASTTTTVMVDDSDPGIEYRGSWVHNAIDDPKDLNYGGSTTFTNATGSTATYRFQGIAIAVYGAFEVAGTFAMHSSYSIDSGAPADFLPAGTVLRPAYRQKFFQSGTLSNGAHTLVITNLEREFWLDYLVVTQPSAASTSTAAAAPKSTAPQEVQTPTTTSTAQASPATTGSFASQPETTSQTSSGPSSQTAQNTNTHSFSNTNNVTLTSTEAAVAPSLTASESQTSVPASGTASPSSIATRGSSTQFPAGAIAGVAVGSLLVLALCGVVGHRCRRRRETRRKRPDLTPYDPGLTTFAIEPSEKRHAREHDSDGASRGSTATSVSTLLIPVSRSAPTNAYAHAPAETRTSRTSGERIVPHDIRTTDLEATGGSGTHADDRRTGFEPLGSPSSASPLLSRMRTQKDSPVMPGRYRSPLDVDIDMEGGRRSLDGGVRLAGGPPDAESARRADDARSGVSTLPPAYRVYPAA